MPLTELSVISGPPPSDPNNPILPVPTLNEDLADTLSRNADDDEDDVSNVGVLLASGVVVSPSLPLSSPLPLDTFNPMDPPKAFRFGVALLVPPTPNKPSINDPRDSEIDFRDGLARAGFST